VHETLNLLNAYRPWLVLSGAGVSAESGVPTYRNKQGDWQRLPPVTHQEFMANYSSRQRFWARNMVGWRFMQEAKPNAAHSALVGLQKRGLVSLIVTQNVDGLHQQAGSQQVIDLHGRVDRVSCMSCGLKFPRGPLQTWLEANNPEYARLSGAIAPDGDADIDQLDYRELRVPDCEHCGGVLKPDAVFYGDSVPRETVTAAESAMQQAQGLLVVGSSLMVFSGYRFCRWAQQQGKPIVLLNQGVTRADDLATVKDDNACGLVLNSWLAQSAV
jgi:NAD-dependent SIR2 family protein deacetylase